MRPIAPGCSCNPISQSSADSHNDSVFSISGSARSGLVSAAAFFIAIRHPIDAFASLGGVDCWWAGPAGEGVALVAGAVLVGDGAGCAPLVAPPHPLSRNPIIAQPTRAAPRARMIGRVVEEGAQRMADS